MGKRLLNGCAIEIIATLSPRMVRRRCLGMTLEGFDVHDFSLARGLAEDGVG
jgi:hypothetical protein